MADPLQVPLVAAPDFLLCADWSASPSRRAVFLVDVAARRVAPAGASAGSDVDGASWTARRLLETARALRARGTVLVAVDAPLGLPGPYLEVLARRSGWQQVRTFVDWLRHGHRHPEVYVPVREAAAWDVTHPFFPVPAGAGGLTRFAEVALREGVPLVREVDRRVGGKSAFIVAGIPGCAGGAAVALWRELGGLLEEERRAFRLWPFEGSLGALLAQPVPVLGETYPRAAYAHALREEGAGARGRLALGKGRREVREAVLERLRGMRWMRTQGVTVSGLDEAVASEDAFDALLTAAGLLRCVLEGTALSLPSLEDANAEGGILSLGGLDLSRPEGRLAQRPPR